MLRPGHALAFCILALTSACDSDVIVEDGGGGNGASGGNGTGASGAGGSDGTGGTDVGGGGGGPEPVPSCEVLEPTGAPYLLPYENAFDGAIAALSEDRLLVVFQTPASGGNGNWKIVSGWVPDPFTTWPPTGASPLFDHHFGLFSGPIRSRSDGAFISTEDVGETEVWGGRSGVPGPFFESEEVHRALLEPNGVGYYTVIDDRLHYYAALTDTEPTEEIELPGAGAELGSDDEGRVVVQVDDALFTLADGALVELGAAPQNLYYRTILPREGGVWYAGKNIPDGRGVGEPVEVWAIDASRSQSVRPFADDAMNQVGFGGWRDQGVAVAGGNWEGGGYQIAITDGVNVTRAALSAADSLYVQNGISVAAAPDGASVYVGYLHGDEGTPAFAIQRFDCVSP